MGGIGRAPHSKAFLTGHKGHRAHAGLEIPSGDAFCSEAHRCEA